jgi:hypothetical protein
MPSMPPSDSPRSAKVHFILAGRRLDEINSAGRKGFGKRGRKQIHTVVLRTAMDAAVRVDKRSDWRG